MPLQGGGMEIKMNINIYERYPQLEGCREQIEKTLELMKETYDRGGKLLLCGNGGSCADCDHIVGELMKGFMERRPLSDKICTAMREKLGGDAEYLIDNLQMGIPAISLAAHSGVMTAFANDVDPDLIYAQMVLGYAKTEDMVIGISTSGNSKNVIHALRCAAALGVCTVGLTGSGECGMDGLCDAVIHVPECETYKVQEYHLPVYHYLCAELERYTTEKA